MKKSRFTESQIVSILNQQYSGQTVKVICREHGTSPRSQAPAWLTQSRSSSFTFEKVAESFT